MSGAIDCETARRLIHDTILGSDFRRATFGGTLRGDEPCPWVRVVVRSVEIQGSRQLQFAYFDGRKDIRHNARAREAVGRLDELCRFGFAGVHLSTATEEIDLRTTKKGKVFVGRRQVESAEEVPQVHNRVKDVPLPEGRADRLLEVLGIATSAGQVRPTMRAKFTQINEFLKQLTHAWHLDEGFARLGRPVRILDCGCGLSYLTLTVHHYLNDLLGVPASILGVDVNDEVIRKSIDRSERLGASGAEFAAGRIGELDVEADIVIALHACDTATDDAIAQAVRSEARILLSVPCCHHHLNEQLRAEGPASVLRPILRHGILHQRTADLVTDAFRALALRILGYRTDVVEFISLEHTARNLMIRAVRGVPVGEAGFVREYLELRRFWGVVPYLERVLGERFQRLVEKPLSPGTPGERERTGVARLTSVAACRRPGSRSRRPSACATSRCRSRCSRR